MNQSESIKDLIVALAKAQAVMVSAKFNRVNPHFKNRYADFTSIMDACRKPLSDNGLATMQYCETINDKLVLTTMLAHTSGEWIKSYFPLNPLNMTSQAIGSAMTYAKRYSLSAMLGIVSDDEDDDGEASHGRPQTKPTERTKQESVQQAQKSNPQKITNIQVEMLRVLNEKLDDECKFTLNEWLFTEFNAQKFDEILFQDFPKILTRFENAVKYVQQKQQQQHQEAINA
jgi:hypothetical protein